MAAPQIPNLLTRPRKAPQPSSYPRNRGPSRHPTHTSTPTTPSSDTVIQSTDTDASLSRLSAASLNYFSDPFAPFFVPASHADLPPSQTRRMPIINRGTYVRTTAIDTLVWDFLERHEGRVQVVSLGAGSDTRFWRFMEGEGWERRAGRVVWHEIDFGTATREKVEVVERCERVGEVLRRAAREARRRHRSDADGHPEDVKGNTTPTQTSKEQDNTEDEDNLIHISPDKTTLHTPNYHLHALDLRHFASANPPPIAHLLPDMPTLLLSECCLTYLSSSTTKSLLTHITRTLIRTPTPLHIILYEPLNPYDAFGRTMTSNLASRGISMPGVEACPTIQAHVERLKGAGFGGAEGTSVGEWWEKRVSGEEKERLRGVEGLDEEEEWVLLAGHYGFVWGWRDAGGEGKVGDA